ncbi:hypothetical protein CK203_112972 [Vitis vinifera]|uniref:Uncharacterized protein n=1 Tax=Vitis vinifera TaxID=29760 RepID=A0A438C9R3_VITVI|nr:hypothetical protein CK203_112972 [Vitis vinifera]
MSGREVSKKLAMWKQQYLSKGRSYLKDAWVADVWEHAGEGALDSLFLKTTP